MMSTLRKPAGTVPSYRAQSCTGIKLSSTWQPDTALGPQHGNPTLHSAMTFSWQQSVSIHQTHLSLRSPFYSPCVGGGVYKFLSNEPGNICYVLIGSIFPTSANIYYTYSLISERPGAPSVVAKLRKHNVAPFACYVLPVDASWGRPYHNKRTLKLLHHRCTANLSGAKLLVYGSLQDQLENILRRAPLFLKTRFKEGRWHGSKKYLSNFNSHLSSLEGSDLGC